MSSPAQVHVPARIRVAVSSAPRMVGEEYWELVRRTAASLSPRSAGKKTSWP